MFHEMFLLTSEHCRFSGVSVEGSGVIVEGSAPIATLPVDDTKASSVVLCSCHRLITAFCRFNL